MAGLKSGAVQLRRGLERKSAARPACSSAHRPGGWRLNEGPGNVGEAIAEKLVKLLSSDAASSLHSVPLPLLEAPDAELRGAKLLGLDRFRLRPDDPARVLRTDKHLLVHIPLQVQDLNVTGKYTALRPHVITKGKFKARLQCLQIYTEIAICSSHPKLETLEVSLFWNTRKHTHFIRCSLVSNTTWNTQFIFKRPQWLSIYAKHVPQGCLFKGKVVYLAHNHVYVQDHIMLAIFA
nr:uncharacterized protein LOC126544069 isoform X2 [Dermacentor andersoni]